MKFKTTILAALGIFAASATSGFATTIAVDESGNYVLNGIPQAPGVIAAEPFSGLSGLVFPLPFAGNRGDIVLVDQSGSAGDVIRFGGNAKMYFFSLDDELTSDALADTPTLPQANAALPQIAFQEVGGEGSNGLFYNSGSGGIGGDGANPVQFTFASDGVVPEPSTFILLGLGGAGVGLASYRRRKARE